MVPYATFLYFGVVLCLIVPAVVLRLATRRIRWAVLLPTAVMLAAHAPSDTVPGIRRATISIVVVIAFALLQWLVAVALLWTTRAGPARARTGGVLSLSCRRTFAAGHRSRLRPDLDRAIALVGSRTSPSARWTSCSLSATAPSSACRSTRTRRSCSRSRRFRRALLIVSGAFTRIGSARRPAPSCSRISTPAFTTSSLASSTSSSRPRSLLTTGCRPRHTITGSRRWSGTCTCTPFLFFDFAGYSRFAIGVSAILGVHPPENFRPSVLRAQYPRLLGPLAHQPVVVVPRPCLYAVSAGRDARALVPGSSRGVVRGPGSLVRVDGSGTVPTCDTSVYGLYHAVLLIGFDVYRRVRPRPAVGAAVVGAVGGCDARDGARRLLWLSHLFGHLIP